MPPSVVWRQHSLAKTPAPLTCRLKPRGNGAPTDARAGRRPSKVAFACPMAAKRDENKKIAMKEGSLTNLYASPLAVRRYDNAWKSSRSWTHPNNDAIASPAQRKAIRKHSRQRVPWRQLTRTPTRPRTPIFSRAELRKKTARSCGHARAVKARVLLSHRAAAIRRRSTNKARLQRPAKSLGTSRD
jgi:hypothetical protein